MADYYQDLLGGAQYEAPQKEIEPEREPALPKRSVAGPCQNESDMSLPAKRGSERSPIAKPVPQPSPAAVSLPRLEEHPVIKPPATSPIIPAAFPKLAPKPIEAPNTQTLDEKLHAAPKEQVEAAPVTAPPEQSAPEDTARVSEKAVESPATKSFEQVNTELAAERASDGMVEEPRPWLDNGRPDWAQDRFECLLFSVAGLKLAVPLISLGSIHKLDKDLTPLVGRASWFMGLYRSGDRNIRVVDTAKWVMPDRYHDAVKDGYDFIIRLGDSDWGMACDSVEQAIQLEPEQVKWRTERSKRPWLSGTVIEHMCALLDADTLGWLLDKDARKH